MAPSSVASVLRLHVVSPWYLTKTFLVAVLWLLAWVIFGVIYIFFGAWNIVAHRRAVPEEPVVASSDDGVSETLGQNGNPASLAFGPASSSTVAPQSPSVPSAPPPVEVQKLSDEVEGLQGLIHELLEASPSNERRMPEPTLPAPAPLTATPVMANATMDATIPFANHIPQTGPISHTSLRMQQEQGGADPAFAAARVPPPGLAARRPDAPVAAQPQDQARVGWAPFLAGSKSATQARDLAQALAHWEAQKSLDPNWGAHFWQDVSRLERSQLFEQDLVRVLAAGGHLGPSTIGPPRASLKRDLEAMRDVGAPALGAGLNLPPTAPWNWSTPSAAGQPASASAASTGSRWSHGLPADLPRAAPEIYRSMRAEACANAREWLSAHFKGSRACTNGEWTGLWNAATELDFFVNSLPADQVMQQLATSDVAEMRLRALAAYVYQARTGDITGGHDAGGSTSRRRERHCTGAACRGRHAALEGRAPALAASCPARARQGSWTRRPRSRTR